jgi:hypothetical protein
VGVGNKVYVQNITDEAPGSDPEEELYGSFTKRNGTI